MLIFSAFGHVNVILYINVTSFPLFYTIHVLHVRFLHLWTIDWWCLFKWTLVGFAYWFQLSPINKSCIIIRKHSISHICIYLRILKWIYMYILFWNEYTCISYFFHQNVSRNSAFDKQRNSSNVMTYIQSMYAGMLYWPISMGLSLTITTWHVNNININISLIIQFFIIEG